MIIRIQTLDETLCISHKFDTLAKGMYTTIFSPSNSFVVKLTGLFEFGMTAGLGEG